MLALLLLRALLGPLRLRYVESFRLPSITSASRGAGSGSGLAGYDFWVPDFSHKKKSGKVRKKSGKNPGIVQEKSMGILGEVGKGLSRAFF